jgi:hypothetical protein
MMSSKVNQLENQRDRVSELNHFKKLQSNGEADEKIKAVDNTDNFTNDIGMIESSKTPSEKINIEIDIFQRTAVFSDDVSMWI